MAMSEAIVTSKQGLAEESATWAARAKGLQIIDKETYLNASHLLRSVKTFRVQIAVYWAPHIDAAMETKRKADVARKALVDEKDRMEAPLVEAEGLLKRNLLAWDETQEQARQAQERQLQAEARKQAEALTLAAAAAMELEATATGDTAMLQEAVDILEQPMDLPVVTVRKLMPKVQGIVYRDHWEAHQTVDIKALAAAVAAGSASPHFLIPNMTALNTYARATEGTQPVPGVKFWNNRGIAARG